MVCDRVLLDDNGIGAVRDHPAGKDPDGFALANSFIERPAGCDLADDPEPSADVRGIGGPQRIAVHRGHWQRRLAAQCRDVARKHAVMGRVQRYHFLRQRLGAGQDGSKGVSDRHQRHGKLLDPKRGQRLGHIIG
jgi:hypothetical protein